jgi:hypothetical protein
VTISRHGDRQVDLRTLQYCMSNTTSQSDSIDRHHLRHPSFLALWKSRHVECRTEFFSSSESILVTLLAVLASPNRACPAPSNSRRSHLIPHGAAHRLAVKSLIPPPLQVPTPKHLAKGVPEPHWIRCCPCLLGTLRWTCFALRQSKIHRMRSSCHQYGRRSLFPHLTLPCHLY